MIQVNLLPPEHRVKDRAPVSRLVGMVAALLVTFLAMGAYLYTKMFLVRTIAEAKREREADKQRDLVRAKVYDELEREVKAYKTREDKIDEIARTDPMWAPMLYALTKMTWDGEQADQATGFTAWFSNMSVAMVKPSGPSRQKGEVPELKMKVATATDDVSRVTNFFRALDANGYFRDYFDLGDRPHYRLTKQEFAQFEPSAAYDFEAKVQRLPTDELLKRFAGEGKAGDGKAPPGKAPPAKGPGPGAGDGKKG